MVLPQFSAVRLLSDRHRDKGVEAGSIGRILDVYGEEAYEVEFSRPDGTTIAWFAVPPNEIELVELPAEVAPQEASA